jgi:hypothetical protein
VISWRSEAVLGLLLIVLGLAILGWNLNVFDAGGAVMGFLLFGALGVVFLVLYRKDDGNWWASIPAGALFGLSAVSLLGSIVDIPSSVLGAVFLWAGAAPFLLLFRREPRFFWAAMPGGFLALLGLLALISGTRVGEALLTLFIYWGIAIVFAVVFLRGPARWWAVIPAGSLFSLGLVELLERTDWGGASAQGFVFCLGLAATFGFLYLIRSEANGLQWAKVPAIILLVLSLLFLFSALAWGGFTKILALLLVAGGIYLIFSTRRSKPRGKG